MNWSNRISVLRDSIFGEMSLLAKQHQAINLSQGFSEEDTPQEIKDRYCKAIQAGHNQYAPYKGMFQLLTSIKHYNQKWHNISINENNITVTNGATEAIANICQTLIEKDDEVILFEPFYDSYFSMVCFYGGVPVCCSLNYPDFQIDFTQLKEKISNKTKAIFFNNPHNPSGRIFSPDEINQLIQIATDHDLYLICDEVYEFLAFDQKKFYPAQSIVSCHEYEKIISISSASKTFDATGWKVGWLYTSERLNEQIQKVHQYNTFCANTPAQVAIAESLDNLDSYIQGYVKRYQKKLDFLCSLLDSTDIDYVRPEGTFFLVANISSLNIKSDDLAKKLVRDYQLALVPMESFYHYSKQGEDLIRFCFAKRFETMEKALELFQKALIDLEK